MKTQPTVLLVEDEAVIPMIHFKYLLSLGCKVEIAVDSDEAQQKISGSYDMVFMDIWLTGISGVDVTKNYWEVEKREKPLRIIF